MSDQTINEQLAALTMDRVWPILEEQARRARRLPPSSASLTRNGGSLLTLQLGDAKLMVSALDASAWVATVHVGVAPKVQVRAATAELALEHCLAAYFGLLGN